MPLLPLRPILAWTGACAVTAAPTLDWDGVARRVGTDRMLAVLG